MSGKLLAMENTNHRKAPEARAKYLKEKRICSSKAYFQSQVIPPKIQNYYLSLDYGITGLKPHPTINVIFVQAGKIHNFKILEKK